MISMGHLPSIWHLVSSIPPNTRHQVSSQAQNARQCQRKINWEGGRQSKGNEKEAYTFPEMPNVWRRCTSLCPRLGYQESAWREKAEKNKTYSSNAPPIFLVTNHNHCASQRLKMKASEDLHTQIRYKKYQCELYDGPAQDTSNVIRKTVNNGEKKWLRKKQKIKRQLEKFGTGNTIFIT